MTHDHNVIVSTKREVFTVGHSNHPAERFVELLAARKTDVVADVRSQPYSRYNPQFNKKPLERTLQEAGMDYCFLGREIGGMPNDDEFYDDDGYVLYRELAATERFKRGLAELKERLEQDRTVIMCAEENPRSCHRGLLIGRELRRVGVTVIHIRWSGVEEVEPAFDPSGGTGSDEIGGQASLFGDDPARPWRSLRPAPRRKRSAKD